jgi:hypothetical protein
MCRIKGFRMYGSIKFLLTLAALVPCVNAKACELTRLLSGRSEAVVVTNQGNEEIYKTYMVRNAVRDRSGRLSAWVKFELVPERWGFDLVSPSGKTFALTSNEGGPEFVQAFGTFEKACRNKRILLRRGSTRTLNLYDGKQKIGSIENFPFHELPDYAVVPRG